MNRKYIQHWSIAVKLSKVNWQEQVVYPTKGRNTANNAVLHKQIASPSGNVSYVVAHSGSWGRALDVGQGSELPWMSTAMVRNDRGKYCYGYSLFGTYFDFRRKMLDSGLMARNFILLKPASKVSGRCGPSPTPNSLPKKWGLPATLLCCSRSSIIQTQLDF